MDLTRLTEKSQEALRQAQIETREEYPHPYYWAGFVLTGDGGEVSGEVVRELKNDEVPTAVPSVATESAPPSVQDPSTGGLCVGSSALPVGLIVLAGIRRKRSTKRNVRRGSH